MTDHKDIIHKIHEGGGGSYSPPPPQQIHDDLSSPAVKELNKQESNPNKKERERGGDIHSTHHFSFKPFWNVEKAGQCCADDVVYT